MEQNEESEGWGAEEDQATGRVAPVKEKAKRGLIEFFEKNTYENKAEIAPCVQPPKWLIPI